MFLDENINQSRNFHGGTQAFLCHLNNLSTTEKPLKDVQNIGHKIMRLVCMNKAIFYQATIKFCCKTDII